MSIIFEFNIKYSQQSQMPINLNLIMTKKINLNLIMTKKINLNLNIKYLNFNMNSKKLNFPQNVMKRVHSTSEYKKQLTVNTKLFTIQEQNESGTKDGKNICQTQNKPQEQRVQETKEVKEDYFLGNRLKYDKVRIADAQGKSILQNMRWIGRVQAQKYIKSAFSGENLQIQKSEERQFQQQEKFNNNLLQLKCMLRYRYLKQILLQAKELTILYEKHDEYIADPEDYFKASISVSHDHFRQTKILISDFHKQILQKFTKLLIDYSMKLPFASEQNKMVAKEVYEKNGYVVNRLIVKGGTSMSVERSSDYNNHRLRKFFESEGLFEAHKIRMSQFSQVPIKQNMLPPGQLVEPSEVQKEVEIRKQVMKEPQAYQDVEIDGPTKFDNSAETDYQI